MKFLLPALIIIVLVFIFRPKQKMTVPPNARAGFLSVGEDSAGDGGDAREGLIRSVARWARKI
jgi:hypothetical protein